MHNGMGKMELITPASHKRKKKKSKMKEQGFFKDIVGKNSSIREGR